MSGSGTTGGTVRVAEQAVKVGATVHAVTTDPDSPLARHAEVVLTGVHLGHYGLDRCKGRPKAEWVRLSHLIGMLARLPAPSVTRLRV